MKQKYLIGDILNCYYLKDGFKGLNSDSLTKSNNISKNLRNYNQDGKIEKEEITPFELMNYKGNYHQLNYSFSSNEINIFHIVIYPMTVQKYENTEMYVLEEGIKFSVFEDSYEKETGMVLIKIDEVQYVASIDEVSYFSIPLFQFKEQNITYCPFKLILHKIGFWNEKLDILFNTIDIPKEYQENIIPLLGLLKQFIELQDEYVYKYFLGNILNLLNDAKKMLCSELLDEEKEKLLKETILILKKLKKTIENVSPFQYEKVKTVEDYITFYYEKKEKKEKDKLKIEQESKKNRKQIVKNYMENIKAKSELLDYFNMEFGKTN